MGKTLKTRPGILVPTVEEVTRISDAERERLRKSLEKARADIAAGDYDVVTPTTLRREFDDIFHGGKTDEKLGVAVPRKPAPKRKKR
jgi:hypothetical protein